MLIMLSTRDWLFSLIFILITYPNQRLTSAKQTVFVLAANHFIRKKGNGKAGGRFYYVLWGHIGSVFVGRRCE